MEELLNKLSLKRIGTVSPRDYLTGELYLMDGEKVVVEVVKGNSFVELLFGSGKEKLKGSKEIGIPVLSAYLSDRKRYFGLKSVRHEVKDGFLARVLKVSLICELTGLNGLVVGLYRPFLKGNKKVAFKDLKPYLIQAKKAVNEFLPLDFSFDSYGKVGKWRYVVGKVKLRKEETLSA